MEETNEEEVASQLLRSWPEHRWERVTDGCSPARVFRMSRQGQVVGYAKQARPGGPLPLQDEIARLRWAAGRIPSPRLLDAGRGSWVWMVTSVVQGEAAHEPTWRRAPEATVVQLAATLRQLHAVPIDDCPFDARLPVLMERVRTNVAMEWVDEEDFDPERRGWTGAEVLAELEASQPSGDPSVLTHGDPCLPNVVLDGAGGYGWIDLGGLGVGDPYRDLALMARSAEYNLGRGWGERLLEAYGGPIDRQRLSWYRLLDELM
ncbi:MAG: aminoglycoside 3'-phosphotransferase [Deltaproteobacteria bacterium]|nr:aminoglycoside 3'-phosphotransferase [Deltaproteobacteria bacterium]